MRTQTVIFEDLGLIGYQEAWDYQEKLLQANIQVKTHKAACEQPEGVNAGETEQRSFRASTIPGTSTETIHHLLFAEHPLVYTIGKSGKMQNILIDEAAMHERDIEFFQTNRGGDITFHGPGQIVGYPILDLEKIGTDIGKYLRNLEEIIILTLQDYGIRGERSAGETGVWIDPGVMGRERKITAIGVRCSRWITMHGFAFNINTDLSYFDHIIPCGIQNKKVTSLEKELERRIDMEDAKERVKYYFQQVFNVVLE